MNNGFGYIRMVKSHWPILFVLLYGCGKQNPFVSEDAPPLYLGGFVCQINTDIPVAGANVYFLKYESTDWLGPNAYSLVGQTQSDSSGRFEIPLDLDADLIRAVGLESQFELETDDNYQSYKANGGFCRLQLTPKAWVKVKAVDIEPLNPEVLYVSALPPGGAMDFTNISEDWVVWQTSGNIPSMFGYRLMHPDGSFDVASTYGFVASGLDTLSIMINY
jgi:hypothetical protein